MKIWWARYNGLVVNLLIIATIGAIVTGTVLYLPEAEEPMPGPMFEERVKVIEDEVERLVKNQELLIKEWER